MSRKRHLTVSLPQNAIQSVSYVLQQRIWINKRAIAIFPLTD
ncbi:MAG: hypothetical protein RID53_22140 [Coleofasciculus sp. B1-GNL1-01]